MQQQQNTNNISVTWRGRKFILEMNSDASLKDLGHELQKLTDVKEDTMRLLVPSRKSSKLFSPFSNEHSCLTLQETSLFEGRTVKMMGVSKDEVDEVQQNAKADLRIAGFDEEEKRLRQRKLDGPHTSLRLPQGAYIFRDFRTLHIPGIELNPPASEALKLMHKLAADPGIVAVLNKHRWRVGIMTEMAPVGYVGVSPKCILGFNKNHGEEISLRLRTDDLKGFRKYESIKKTLLHELAHMVFSEHDANFYALDNQLNKEAATLDWTKSRSHTLIGVHHSQQNEEVFIDDRSSLPQKLGGNTSDQLADARVTSVAAAYSRLANMSRNVLESSKPHEEPDDSGYAIHQSPDFVSANEKDLNITNANEAQRKLNDEPDPDDCSCVQNKFEPDPDDSKDVESMESRPYTESYGSRITSEPDPDDSEMTEFLPMSGTESTRTKAFEESDPDDLEVPLKHGFVIDEGLSGMTETMESWIQPRKISHGPDPDDSGAAGQNNIGYGNRPYQNDFVVDKTMDDQGQVNRICREPDPDDSSQANAVMRAELDPDDNMVPQQSAQANEPDPDDQELQRIQDPVTIICGRLQKAIEMLRSEVNPSDAITCLQILSKIIRNVIEHPDDMKFKRLRKANPMIQRNVVSYKAAMEILYLIGFNEDVVFDEIGKMEAYLVLKRNDPGLLWLAKSSLETCIAC